MVPARSGSPPLNSRSKPVRFAGTVGQATQSACSGAVASGCYSREYLQTALWQGSTYRDFEKGLNGAIHRFARKPGGTPVPTPSRVRPFPGGYRFIAELEQPCHGGNSGPTVVPPVGERSAKSGDHVSRRHALFVVAALVLGIFGIGFWNDRTSRVAPGVNAAGFTSNHEELYRQPGHRQCHFPRRQISGFH